MDIVQKRPWPHPLILNIREVTFVLAHFGHPWGNFFKGPNSNIAELQIDNPPYSIDWKIWKALYSRGWVFVRHGHNSSDVTLAFEDAQVIQTVMDDEWWMMDDGM